MRSSATTAKRAAFVPVQVQFIDPVRAGKKDKSKVLLIHKSRPTQLVCMDALDKLKHLQIEPITNAAGQHVSWSLSDNWRNVIIGAVILAAVILDQMSHVLKNRKRTATAQVKPVTSAIPPPPAH